MTIIITMFQTEIFISIRRNAERRKTIHSCVIERYHNGSDEQASLRLLLF